MRLEIGKKLKELRQLHLVTQETLAKYLCVSHQTISKWESGSALPSIDYIIPIIEFLKYL